MVTTVGSAGRAGHGHACRRRPRAAARSRAGRCRRPGRRPPRPSSRDHDRQPAVRDGDSRTQTVLAPAVLGRVGQRLGDREVGRRLDRRGRAGRAGRCRPSTGSGTVSASARTAPSRPRSASTGGWMPRTRSRSSARAVAAGLAGLGQQLRRRRRVAARAAPRPGRGSCSSATSRAWAPSCRSRSIRRSSAAWASTASARVSVSSRRPAAPARPPRVGAQEERVKRASMPVQPAGSGQPGDQEHARPAGRPGSASTGVVDRPEDAVAVPVEREVQQHGTPQDALQPVQRTGRRPAGRTRPPATAPGTSQARSRQVAGSVTVHRNRRQVPTGCPAAVAGTARRLGTGPEPAASRRVRSDRASRTTAVTSGNADQADARRPG